MTVSAQTPAVTLDGNGVTTVWSYSFEVPFQDDGTTPAVSVYIQDGTLDPVYLSPSLYIISGVGVPTGGTVTYPIVGTPLSSGWHIIISRALRYTQAYAANNPALVPVENAMDRLELQIQQLSLGTGGGSAPPPPVSAGVDSFNGRDGVVTLTNADVLAAIGYTPVNKAGDTMGGRLSLQPSTMLGAGVNLGVGSAPTAPVNGDLWSTTAGFFGRAGGVTVGPFGTGGGSFNETTGYALGVQPNASLNLVQRGNVFKTLFDYGAAGDGVTDDTAAFNRMVADVNAGNIHSIFIPGFTFFIPGDTTAFTRGCSICGTGNNSILKTTNGTGTSTILNFLSIAGTDFVTLSDFKMTCSVQPKVRQAIQISWATESLVFSITNVSMDGAFAKGIGIHNAVVGNFTNVTLNGYNHTNNQWAWNITSDVGRYGVELRWVSCNVSGWNYGYKGSGHLEGLMWQQCVVGFCDYGWWMDVSDTTNGPEFHIHDCQCEVLNTGAYFNNVAYVYVSDYSFYVNSAAVVDAVMVYIKNCVLADVHDCQFVGLSSNIWHGVRLENTIDAKVHDNIFRILRGNGVLVYGSTTNCQITNNHYQGLVAGAIPYGDAVLSTTNIRRGQTTDNTTNADWMGLATNVGSTFTSGTTPAIFAGVNNWVAVPGDKILVRALVNANPNGGAAPFISIRIREYNHRPGTGSPYDILRHVTNNYWFETFSLQSTHPLVKSIDAEFDIIAYAADAYIVVEIWTSTGTFDGTAQLKVQRL